MAVSEIIVAMARDLGLRQFHNESEIQYSNRVLYSAMSSWIKTSTLDKSITDRNAEGVSKKHVLEKCSRILDEMLLRCPQSKMWFNVDGEEAPIAIIRQRLMQSGDLVRIGYDTRIGLVEMQRLELGCGLSQLIGAICEKTYLTSGIALVSTSIKTDEMSVCETTSHWMQKYVKNAWWKSGSYVDENTEFFDAEKPSQNNYSCWCQKRTRPFISVILTRHALNNQMYEYILEKKEDGITYYHKLDPFLQEMHEHRRMMFALRSIAKNPVGIKARVFNDHIQLAFRTFVPQKENVILETFGWPCAHITDKLNWDIPTIVWPFIKHTFVNLEAKITEEYDG